MTSPFSAHRQALAAWALFGLLSALFFWQPLLTDGVLIPTNPRAYEPWATADDTPFVSNNLMSDALTLTYPWRLYSHQVLRDGDIPFWNPYIFSGYPHLAALQSNVLYPPVVLFDLWRPIAGIAYAMALHLALAGGLMFCFLRRLGLGYAAATFGGVVFELNGFFMVRMSAPSYVFSGIWTPLLLIGVRDLIDGAGWRASWKVVLPTCMALLGGHPQILVLSLLIAAIYGLFTAWPRLAAASSRRRAAARLLGAGLATGLGVGLGGAQLLPFLELVEQTERSPAAFEEYQSLALPITALAQALVPDIFGHPVDETYTLESLRPAPEPRGKGHLWFWNYCGENLFTGITPILFAALALLRSRHREGLCFGLLFAVALLVLLGTPPVLRLFYDWVPTFQFSRADRVIYVYVFAVSVLASLGFAGAENDRRHRPTDPPSHFGRWMARIFLILPFLPAILGSLTSATTRSSLHRALSSMRAPFGSPDLSAQLLEAAAVTLASLGLLAMLSRCRRANVLLLTFALLLATIPLLRFGWRFNPVQAAPFFPTSPQVSVIEKETGDFGRIGRLQSFGLRSNLAQSLGFFDVNGASAAALARYTRIIQSLDGDAVLRQKSFRTFRDEAILESPLLNFLGVRVVIADHLLPNLSRIPTDIPNSNLSLFRNPSALPRFFLVDQVEAYQNVDRAVRRLISSGFDPATVALVEGAARVVLEKTDETDDDQVEVLAYRAQEIELRVYTGVRRLLVSSEVDYPGWEVDIDGRRATKVLVNTAFRGVVVESGEHHIRFHFVPRSFYAGLLLSLSSLALLMASFRWPVWFDQLAAEEKRK